MAPDVLRLPAKRRAETASTPSTPSTPARTVETVESVEDRPGKPQFTWQMEAGLTPTFAGWAGCWLRFNCDCSALLTAG